MLKKIIIFLLLLLIIPSISLAAIRANQSWPASPLGTEITFTCDDTGNPYFIEDIDEELYDEQPIDIPHLITYFYEWIIVLGGLAVFVAFIWAGLLLLTSVGDAGKMSQARKKMQNSLIGFLILLSSYLIFYTINPELVGERTIDGVSAGSVEDMRALININKRAQSFKEAYNACHSVEEQKGNFNFEIGLYHGLDLWVIPNPVTVSMPAGDILFGIAGGPDISYTAFDGTTITNCNGLKWLIGVYPDYDDAPYPNFIEICTSDLGQDQEYGVCETWENGNCIKWHNLAGALAKKFPGRTINDYRDLAAAMNLPDWPSD